MGFFDFLRRKKPEPVPAPVTAENTQRPDPRAEALEYLTQIGRQNDADKRWTLRVILPDGSQAELELSGWQRAGDALAALQAQGFIGAKEPIRFADWPTADPRIGPWARHMSACVCELESRTLTLETFDPNYIVCLYGCPNAGELTDRSLPKTVEVLNYE